MAVFAGDERLVTRPGGGTPSADQGRAHRSRSAHVVATSDRAAMFVPAATIQQLYEQLGLDRRKDLDGWNRTAGLREIPSIVAAGDVIASVLGVAEKERAPLVVTGSRLQSPLARVFSASVGTALASHASCAVAVVPP